LEGQSDDLTAQWKSEKAKVGQGAQLRETLDRLRLELANAQRAGDLGRASEIAYGQIPQIEKQLEEAEANQTWAKGPLTPEVVDAEQIAAVVSRWTGVPVDKMLEGEREK
ncbi:type VI secretion system ATPase TssH, partial [Lactiplantibacillus plantarum]|nr:type VI secretion system ATPase TssH [Lactiplantibacillus plantarum]